MFLKKNKNKYCKDNKPVFIVEKYQEYQNTQVRKLTRSEIKKYISER